LDSHGKKVLYNTIVNRDEKIKQLSLLRKIKDYIIPLRHFVYLDFILKQLEARSMENMTDEIKRWIAIINSVDNERFLYYMDAKSVLQKALAKLSENRIKDALSLISNTDVIDRRMVIQFSGRYKSLQEKRLAGLLSTQEENSERNNLSFNLIEYLSDRMDELNK